MLWEICSLLCRTPEISEYLKILWLTSGSQRPTFVIASAVFKYSGTWGSLQWFSRPHRRLAFVQISTETPLDSSSSTIQTIALLLLLPPCLLRGHGQSITFDLTSLNGSYTVKPNGTHIFLKIKACSFLVQRLHLATQESLYEDHCSPKHGCMGTDACLAPHHCGEWEVRMCLLIPFCSVK